MRLLALMFLIGCLVVPSDGSWAADRIWLEPAQPTVGQGNWYPRNIEVLSGRVIALDAEQFRVIPEGKNAETVTSAARVLWVEPEQVSDLEKSMTVVVTRVFHGLLFSGSNPLIDFEERFFLFILVRNFF